ncbi:aldo/keto reductase [Halomonas lysinitropha]|uniref:Oxidoreductase YdhF n=1 Tax=Halomonas lysinitropha TaxID=2607506 RepID=A0A5K1I7W0_9GAMM|nr:aldo/keto reductase [Halomonas lysinitropha]VVZ95162.1 Oxidoreductase YdhF [Halomonas lysinitropha]
MTPEQPPHTLILGMMRLHEDPELQAPERLADWIEARLDQGLDWFDHADIYGGNGHNEHLFGEALRRRPGLAARVKVVTKAGILMAPGDTKHYDSSPVWLAGAIDRALARLGVERLDLFLIHRPDPLMEAEATARVLDDAVRAGKVGALGVSNFLPEQWRRLKAALSHPLTHHQLQLSLTHSAPLLNGHFDALRRDGLSPMAWSPLDGGALFEGVAGQALNRLAVHHGVSPAGLALAWLRCLPGSPVPVIGTLNPARIMTLQDEARLSLPRQDWYALLETARGHEVA